jgi:hypothetical protein
MEGPDVRAGEYLGAFDITGQQYDILDDGYQQAILIKSDSPKDENAVKLLLIKMLQANKPDSYDSCSLAVLKKCVEPYLER